MERGGRDEGFSIPSLRDANLRKACDLNAIVVEEFDAGVSVRKADRPKLVRMIEYVKAHSVVYCIPYKVDSLARNRADDVAIHLALCELDDGNDIVDANRASPSTRCSIRHSTRQR